jgi:hypothetical protein
MKVKWERRDAGKNGRHASLHAVLVDGVVDNRETVLARLGSIEQRFLTVKVRCTREFHQGLFWVHVDQALSGLQLDAAARAAVEAQVAETVPKPGCEWALWGVTCIPHYD